MLKKNYPAFCITIKGNFVELYSKNYPAFLFFYSFLFLSFSWNKIRRWDLLVIIPYVGGNVKEWRGNERAVTFFRNKLIVFQ
jgi:hypothetical protein